MVLVFSSARASNFPDIGRPLLGLVSLHDNNKIILPILFIYYILLHFYLRQQISLFSTLKRTYIINVTFFFIVIIQEIYTQFIQHNEQ